MSKTTRFDSGKIDFVGKIKFFTSLSVAMVVISLILIFGKGLNYGIDFAGGTEVQVKFASGVTEEGEIRKFMADQGLDNVHLQKLGQDQEYLLRFESQKGSSDEETNRLQNENVKKVREGIMSTFASFAPEIRRVDTVGPQVGDQMKRNGILAVFYALIVILIYVGLRFDYEYAPGAVLCLFHDALITVGVFALLGREVNAQLLAAVLTIVGYSINDTIVVYDRIRETAHTYKDATLAQVINRATNDTLSRTIVTSLTVFISCLSLFWLAGGAIEDFALAMLIGVIVGAYSTIYVASPVVLLFRKFSGRKAAAA